MNCSKCGAELFDGAKFCAACGANVENMSTETMPVAMTPTAFVIPESAPVLASTAPESEAAPIVSAPAATVIPEGFPETAAPSGVTAASVMPEATGKTSVKAKKEKSGEKKSGKKVLVALIAVLILIVLGVAVFFGAQFMLKSLGGGTSGAERYMSVSGDDESFFYTAPDQYLSIDGRIASSNSSMDGKIVAVLSDTDEDGHGTLSVCNGKDIAEISDDVGLFTISDSGNTIAYLSDYDDDQTTATLYLYDVKSAESNDISDEVIAQTGVTLSSDGKSYSYCSDADFDDSGYVTTFTTYISKNGADAEEFGENRVILAIADGASFMYYAKVDLENSDDPELYVAKGEDETKLGTMGSDFAFYLNRDSSELLFVRNGKTYISKNGGEKEEICGSCLEGLVLPAETNRTYGFMQTLVEHIDIASFKDHLITLEDDAEASIAYLDKNFEVQEIASFDTEAYNYNFYVSKDDKALCYVDDNGELRVYSNYKDLNAEPVSIELDNDAIDVTPSPDFTVFYVTDDENTLFACRTNEDPVELAEDVDSWDIQISADGSRAYFVGDQDQSDDNVTVGTLYSVANTKDAEPEEIADDVYWVNTSKIGVVYYVLDKVDEDTGDHICEAFYARDGVNFTSIMDDAIF